MNTPVALIFFNRPDTLKLVFEKVREARPPQLFLIQDGARENNPNDEKGILACREIVEDIDWDCEVHRNYSELNLGCGKRPSSGISWVLSQVERTIILEDDCVPDLSFFSYCDEMLERYKDDERICYISGLNHFEEWDFGGSSYGFTKGGAIWGWATWRRAWARYDYSVAGINDGYIEKLIHAELPRDAARIEKWKKTHRLVQSGEKISYWDFQWGFVKYAFHQLTIVPKYNLITNIGVGEDATHGMKHFNKHRRYHDYNYMPTRALEKPLVHPQHMLCDVDYDRLLRECNKKQRRWALAQAVLNKILRKK